MSDLAVLPLGGAGSQPEPERWWERCGAFRAVRIPLRPAGGRGLAAGHQAAPSAAMHLGCGAAPAEAAARATGHVERRDGRWCIVEGGTPAWRGRRVALGLPLPPLSAWRPGVVIAWSGGRAGTMVGRCGRTGWRRPACPPDTKVAVSREFVNRLAAYFAMFLRPKTLTYIPATRIRTARELPFEGHQWSVTRCRRKLHRHGVGIWARSFRAHCG